MKKILIILLCLILALSTLAGCSKNEKTGGPGNTKSPQNSEGSEEEVELEEAMKNLDEALSQLAAPGWPKNNIPDAIPEYPYGDVKNSGDGGDGEYYILISPTNKDDLAEYLALLEEQGFTISDGDRARIGTLEINFQFNNSETLQMSVYDSGTSEWPELMGGVLPPDTGTLYGEIYIPELSESDNANGQYYSASFTLVDLTEEDCIAFMEKQMPNGWEGSSNDMISKEVTIDGVVCDLMLQFVQYYDGEGDFNLEAWKK